MIVSSNTTQSSLPATSHTATSTTVTVLHSLSQTNNSGNKTITSTVSALNSTLSSNSTMSTTKAIHAGAPGIASSNVSSTTFASSSTPSSNLTTSTTKAIHASAPGIASITSTVSSISSGKGEASGTNPISTVSSSSTRTTASTATLSITNSDSKAQDPGPVSDSTIANSTPTTTQTRKMASVASSMRTSDSDSPIGNVSRVTSIITSTSQRTTSTSTITDQPESTFSSAVPITVIDPSGKSSLSFPPLVTVFSTTSETNGSAVTFTHVIANPTGLIGGEETQSSAFLNNGGKVAGVFVVVGIVIASVVLFACLTFRRRRNQARRRKRWLANIQRPLPLPPDPFEDPQEPRPMMQVESPNLENHHGNVANNPSHTYPENGTSIGLALTGMESIRADEPVDEVYANEIRHTIFMNHEPRRSFAQSSPSLYPPSLPPDDTRLGKDDGVELAPKQPLDEHRVVPPRPPRSPFREGSTKYTYPITPPPSSTSSHNNDFPPTPESYKPSPFAESIVRTRTSQDEILTRPTLLDIRHRASANPEKF